MTGQLYCSKSNNICQTFAQQMLTASWLNWRCHFTRLVSHICCKLTYFLFLLEATWVLSCRYLKTRGNGQMLDDTVFIVQCRQLLLHGDTEQLRYIRQRACELCRIFAECCRRRLMVIKMIVLHTSWRLFAQWPSIARSEGSRWRCSKTPPFAWVLDISPFRFSSAMSCCQNL